MGATERVTRYSTSVETQHLCRGESLPRCPKNVGKSPALHRSSPLGESRGTVKVETKRRQVSFELEPRSESFSNRPSGRRDRCRCYRSLASRSACAWFESCAVPPRSSSATSLGFTLSQT
jgi:hypothetical protein